MDNVGWCTQAVSWNRKFRPHRRSSPSLQKFYFEKIILLSGGMLIRSWCAKSWLDILTVLHLYADKQEQSMCITLIKRPDHCRTLVKRRPCQIGGLQTWNHFAMLTTTPAPDPHVVIFHWITKLNTVYLFVRFFFFVPFFLKCFPGSLMYCSLVSVLLQEAFLK